MLVQDWMSQIRQRWALVKKVTVTAMEIPAMATVMVMGTVLARQVMPELWATATGSLLMLATATVILRAKAR